MKIRTAVKETKQFVIKHKTKIYVVATIVVMAKLNRLAQDEQISFIKEKGLWDEYICPEV